MTIITTVPVTCKAIRPDGSVIAKGVIRFLLSAPDTENGVVIPQEIRATSDETGTAIAELWPNSLGAAGTTYRVLVNDPLGGITSLGTATVPNSPCNLWQIIDLGPPPTVDKATLAKLAAQQAASEASASATAAHADRVQADLDAAATAADRAQTGLDQVATGSDRTQTGADRVQTGLDRVATDADRVQTGLDRASTTSSAATATAQAGIATTKAGEAASSASTTAALLAAFQSVFLGDFASDAAAVSFAGVHAISIVDGVMYQNTVSDKFRIYNGTDWQNYDSSAAASQSAAALSAASAASSASAASADRVLADADVVLTHADVVLTHADRTQTGLDRTQTSADKAASDTNAASTHADAVQTAADRVQTGLDKTATAADRVQTGLDRTSTTASAASASASASTATAQVALATTQAGLASGAATTATAQASLAAASAGSAIQQDISGVTAAALHRSPNAVVAMFIYDTTKDSDGGAWTERCQHTSWYNESLNGKWLGACATEAAARAVSGATTGDYFQLTSDGKHYKLNATSGTTRVYRGNKAKFPKLSAILAESGTVIIYDLTDLGRPMWMTFESGVSGSNYNFLCGGGQTSVCALNGKIETGGSTNGLIEIDFALDRARQIYTGGILGFEKNCISVRNSLPYRFNIASNPAIVSNVINAVAMTVLPDAPVDPVSGLQVPTIAVATNGGVSVIKHDGSVVNKTYSPANAYKLALNKTEVFTAGGTSVSYWGNMVWDYVSGAQYLYGAGGAFQYPFVGYNDAQSPISIAGKLVAFAQPFFYGSGAIGGVSLLLENQATRGKGAVAYVGNVFNTGWQAGDIRRAYLADSVVETLSASAELVVNGTFGDSTNWNASISGTITIGSGVLTSVATASDDYIEETSGSYLVAGKTYLCSWTVTASNANFGPRLCCTSPSGTGTYFITSYLGNGSSTGAGSITFVAPITGKLRVYRVGGHTGNASIDNISIKEVVPERSYKASGALKFGSLTKALSSPSASNQLVAYSGFSAANYLQEPYSADLDFGTGEWNVSAWVNIPTRMNQFIKTEALDDAAWTKYESTVDSTKYTAPDGTLTAQKLLATTVNNNHYIRQAVTVGGNGVLTFYAAPGGYNYCSIASNPNGYIHFDLTNGNVSTLGAGWASATCVAQANGFYKITVTASAPQTWVNAIIYMDNAWIPSGATGPWGGVGDPTKGILLWHPDLRDSALASVAPVYQRVNTALDYGNTGVIADRNYSSGAAITLSEFSGLITATAYDGTTTRTVTTSAAYNTGTMLKARAVYRLDGSLSIMVNGVQVAVTYGNPLLTLNNSNAVLTIGNSYALDAPFPGSIALLKLSATAPTPDQALWMYEQEKHLFRDGANCLLPDSGNIVDLTYDEATDKWIAVSAANESDWTGLVRTNVIAVPAGSNIKASAGSGIKLNARSTTSPGVDVTIPAWNLREELVKRAEAAAKKAQPVVIFDYSGGFTATTVNGNTAITSVASLTYPAQGSLIGATVTGTGIPASTVIVAISGTTIYLSKACTASNSAVQIALSDFILPVGYETRAVLAAGAVKQEGSTKDWTRTFDGFREKVTFGTAPGYSAFVEIQAVRSI